VQRAQHHHGRHRPGGAQDRVRGDQVQLGKPECRPTYSSSW
jgi:hypothetical protein